MKKVLLLVIAAPLVLASCASFSSSTRVASPASQIQEDSGNFSCTNNQTGDTLYTSDLNECKKYTSSYRCELDSNWFVDSLNASDCSVKQKKHLAEKDAEFNIDAVKEDYRNALNHLDQRTR